MNLRSKLKNTWLYKIYKGRELNNLKNKIADKYPNNDLIPIKRFNLSTISVGNYSYGELNITTFGNKARLIIGNYVSIAQNVSFILDAEHYMNHISTYPFKVKMIKTETVESFAKGDIVIDDDVWIGYGATILSGVHIGQGSVIAAGAVVNKDVEPYALVGGVPGKVIKYRFEKSVIDFLLTLDYKALTEEMIRSHINDLYKAIDLMPLEEVKKLYSWFPRRVTDEGTDSQSECFKSSDLNRHS